MKSKISTIFYAVAIILLSIIVVVSGYFAKGEWLKGQLGQVMPVMTSAENAQNGSSASAQK